MPIHPETVIQALKRHVLETLKVGGALDGIDADERLSELAVRGGEEDYQIDSIDMVDVLTSLEERLKIEFIEDPEVSDLAASGTLRDFADYLIRHVDPKTIEEFQRERG